MSWQPVGQVWVVELSGGLFLRPNGFRSVSDALAGGGRMLSWFMR